MIIFLAALNDIPKQYYEAIEIDRGNALHRLWNITIPLSSPSIFFNTIMGIIGGFQVFVQPYTLTAGGLMIQAYSMSSICTVKRLHSYHGSCKCHCVGSFYDHHVTYGHRIQNV